jgi:hypothetical protein
MVCYCVVVIVVTRHLEVRSGWLEVSTLLSATITGTGLTLRYGSLPGIQATEGDRMTRSYPSIRDLT